MRIQTLLAAVIFLLTSYVSAADFSQDYVNGKPAAIRVSGMIEPGDAKRLASLIANGAFKAAVLSLDSNGGGLG